MQMLSRLEVSTDFDRSCRIAQQLVDFFELHSGDYRLNQLIHNEQNTDAIFKSLQQITQEKWAKHSLTLHIGKSLADNNYDVMFISCMLY